MSTGQLDELDEAADGVTFSGDRERATPLVESLRARRKAAATKTNMHIVLVPGYDGALAVRLKYPDAGWKPIVKALERARNDADPEAALHGNMDAILACTETVLGVKGGQYVDLRDDSPIEPAEAVEVPLRFGPELAVMLGVDIPSEVKGPARFVLRHVYSPAAAETGVYEGDVALMSAGGAVLTWLQDTSKTLSEDFSGE